MRVATCARAASAEVEAVVAARADRVLAESERRMRAPQTRVGVPSALGEYGFEFQSSRPRGCVSLCVLPAAGSCLRTKVTEHVLENRREEGPRSRAVQPSSCNGPCESPW